ncbi:MAG: MerR family transcriptional regulator [Bryobacteraceae bacterium]
MRRLTIGKVAKQAGINLETIRYYERQGVLPKPPRTASGYRMFPEDAVDRLRFIKRAQELGFSLKEIVDLLEVKPGDCAAVRAKAQAKIADVDAKIQHLQAIRKVLMQTAAACSGRGSLSECSILQTLDGRCGTVSTIHCERR